MSFLINPYLFAVSGGSYGTRATAFFTAAGITDSTQKSAVDDLFNDLDAAGLIDLTDSTGASDKIHALYPFVGGTAATHKYNALRPTDTDADFRIVFSGGWTHSSNGIIANGSNSYGDTKWNPNTVLGTNYGSHGGYNRKTFTTGTNINGCSTNSFSDRFDVGYDSGVSTIFAATGGANSNTAGDTGSNRFILSTRQASNENDCFRDGTLKVNGTQTFTANPNYNYYIGARNNGGSIDYFNNNWEFALYFMGDDLTNTEAADFRTAVDTFETTLGRNV